MKLETKRTPSYRAGLKRIIENSPEAQSESFKEATRKLRPQDAEDRFEDALRALKNENRG